MHSTHRALSLAAGLLAGCATVASAQSELIYYKFDSIESSNVVNYARDSTAATELSGPIALGARFGHVPGALGTRGALRASVFGAAANAVDTGYKGAMSGSITFAWMMKNRSANTPTLHSGLFGRPDLNLNNGGDATGGFKFSGWGGKDLKLDLGKPICYLTGWHHFAVVIDDQKKVASWYWQGLPISTETISTGANIKASATSLFVGRDFYNVCGGYYDLDETRVLDRAATLAEIQAWSKASTPATASFGSGPKVPTMSTSNGAPTLGNANYTVLTQGAPSTFYAMVLGLNRERWGTTQLPVSVKGMIGGEGILRISLNALLYGAMSTGGKGSLKLPIPNDPTLGGLEFYTQAAVQAPEGTGTLRMSNALAHWIGR